VVTDIGRSEWREVSEYALEHVSGRFRVSRASVRGVWIYTAWKRVGYAGTPADWEAILYSQNPAQAMAACEQAHARAQSAADGT
jgi:hypothetical protein